MSLFSRKPLTAEEALDHVRAATGMDAALIVTASGKSGVSPQDRAIAREELAAHRLREPKVVYESGYGDDVPLGVYRREHAAEQDAWQSWRKVREELTAIAFAYTFHINVGNLAFMPMPLRYGVVGEREGAPTLEEALALTLKWAKERA